MADTEALNAMQTHPGMNFPWALCLEQADAGALASLRLTPGIEVAGTGQEIWLRGPHAEETLAAQLLSLPALARYERLPPDQLRRIDQRIPSKQLPALQWQSLPAWLGLELPAAALPATEPAPASLRLVRSGEEHIPDMLLTSIEEFVGFATRAAQVRLERLTFAASADGQVLVRGVPLPPLPGQRFVLHAGVAVPAGFGWAPAVSKEVLARRLGASTEAPVLWNNDGMLLRFHTEQFVPSTRSAVLATASARNEPP